MKVSRIAVLACMACTLQGLTGSGLAAEGASPKTPSGRLDIVDYRHYSLDSWMSAIGLPDDAYKCAADADGRFVSELGGRSHQGVYPNRPLAHPVTIHADLLGGTRRVDQRMHSPRVPVVVTRKCQGDVAVTETLFLARPLDWSAKAPGANRQRRDSQPDARRYLLMAEYVNQGARAVEIVPIVDIGGVKPQAGGDQSRRSFPVSANTRCRISHDVESLVWTSATQARAMLKKMALRPGADARLVLAIDRNGFTDEVPVDWARAETLRQQAVAYWEKSTLLPYDVVQIPDPEIQALLDTSIRELYQMRYVIQGLPAYFFGPGCYNDYWVLDGSFVTEAMDMLGQVDDADGYADYLLLHQQADGRIQCMNKHWKETGIALVTLYRHARLSRNKAWLLSRWPQFVRGVEAIQRLRQTGNSADPQALNYQLSPEGFGDGGVGVGADYTNNHWLLAGMKAACEAAQWLGRTKEATAWSDQYREFQQAFRKAIARDAKTDAQGNRYIPAVMGPRAPQFPTRGQWAFCQGVYPGQIFAKDDPLMLGTMKMLEAREVQGGIVENSGWIGIWAQCGSFYGHDWLWLGDGQRAARLLYAFANHASPMHNWREEMPRQTTPGEKFPYRKGSGDMPHVSAAAEFIRLAVHLIELDRGDELHLLEGMPAQWLGAGMTTRLSGVATPFGPLHLAVQVSQDGRTATAEVQPLAANCTSVVVHRPNGSTSRIAPGQGGKITFPVVPIAP